MNSHRVLDNPLISVEYTSIALALLESVTAPLVFQIKHSNFTELKILRFHFYAAVEVTESYLKPRLSLESETENSHVTENDEYNWFSRFSCHEATNSQGPRSSMKKQPKRNKISDL